LTSSAPKFISFEGGEGAGKSTQLRLLGAGLEARGLRVVCTREPGGAPAAEFLRGVLLRGETSFTPLAEMMLHFAARAEHVERTIRPALAAGAWVLSDRFFDSTEAYQVHGQGADAAALAVLKGLISPPPDLTVMLEVSAEVGAAREAARGRAADRYDRMGPEFHRRVAEGFRAIAAADPRRCVVVNADGTVDAVADRIFTVVKGRFL
jgi:dTMP kinase